jgi:3D-(3,5/4)-trihydroxycyclohexane-1,2-dione acylhydrolase (decyclizing)
MPIFAILPVFHFLQPVAKYYPPPHLHAPSRSIVESEMSPGTGTIRLTMAQAIVRWLLRPVHRIDGVKRASAAAASASSAMATSLPGRGAVRAPQGIAGLARPERAIMGFAAAAYAKQKLRRRFMFCTASAGPGTTNLLTSAAMAHANRLPVLMLCGDTFLHAPARSGAPAGGAFRQSDAFLNDAFKAVSRYWDRITHPAQILQSLPTAIATMLDPADCGPAFLGLPQDVQGWAYDYPEAFFARASTASAASRPTRARSPMPRPC